MCLHHLQLSAHCRSSANALGQQEDMCSRSPKFASLTLRKLHISPRRYTLSQNHRKEGKIMDPIEIMLKEYETLRQESMNAMNNGNRILSFGLAAISAIFTSSIFAYTTGKYSLIPSLALILVIPAISIFILFMWLGEYERMQRAGKFLVKLESKINKEASKELLTWETHLRKSQSHMKYPYNATVLLLIGISGISLVLGLVAMGFSATLMWSVAIAGALFHLGLYLFLVSRISRVRL